MSVFATPALMLTANANFLLTHFTCRYKLVVADDVIKHFDPIRLKIEDYLQNRDYLTQILRKGQAIASERAENTLQEVKQRVGINIL